MELNLRAYLNYSASSVKIKYVVIIEFIFPH